MNAMYGAIGSAGNTPSILQMFDSQSIQQRAAEFPIPAVNGRFDVLAARPPVVPGALGETGGRLAGPVPFVLKLIDFWRLDRRDAAPLLGYDLDDTEAVTAFLDGNSNSMDGICVIEFPTCSIFVRGYGRCSETGTRKMTGCESDTLCWTEGRLWR